MQTFELNEFELNAMFVNQSLRKNCNRSVNQFFFLPLTDKHEELLLDHISHQENKKGLVSHNLTSTTGLLSQGLLLPRKITHGTVGKRGR